MSDAWQALTTSKHWPYIWPCYALAFATFLGLGVHAVRQLAHWKTRADEESSMQVPVLPREGKQSRETRD